MRSQFRLISRSVLILCVLICSAFFCQNVFAASTDTTNNCAGCFMPQGGGTPSTSGEYVSNTLGTFYSYYVEVPSGVSRLVIDLFDADIGAGGTVEAGSGATGRDRDRGGFDTSAVYTLIDPGGTIRNTRYAGGSTSTFSPQGGDNAWLTLFDSNDAFVRDNFGTVAYNNNNGSVNWAGNWIETNDDANAGTGLILITGGELRIGDSNADANPSTIEREANLSGGGFTTATFSFDYRTSGNLEAGDQMRVEVSGNGGGTWTTLETFTNDSTGTRSYSITGSIATNTRVRFIRFAGYDGGGGTPNEFFFVDNLRISGNVTATTVTAGHWELQVDQSAGGDDINALGIRAHDGTSGAGGTEINVYYNTHAEYGVNPPGTGTATRPYTHYPYITSGCTFSQNDFDFDSAGSVQFTSPTRNSPATFTQTIAAGSVSADNVWARNSLAGWTSDAAVASSSVVNGYGIWTMALSISSYVAGGAQNGNYVNEYLGTFQAAANPPTATPSAFRVYLPTDAGAAPLKPYLEQFAVWQSGPNPPVIGSTTRARVQVFVVNPTAFSITFSAANLVTANVPGGVVLYAGNSSVSQGSITAQPAVGGSGNVTWNPGTVAAGATATLFYDINFTPILGTLTAPITATPASGNGTRGQFVDETGNTTQGRATFLFGPLCELTMGTAITTDAMISGFHVMRSSQGAIVEWETASEIGTIGFELMRGNVKVNDKLLPSLVQVPQGGTYRFVDRGAPKSGILEYTLVEVMYDGRRQASGPYRPNAEASRQTVSIPVGDYERIARKAPAEAVNVREGRAEERAYRVVSGVVAGATGIKIGIDKEGMYFVSAADIAAHLGATTAKVQQFIAGKNLSLKNRGVEVSWFAASGNTGIIFYGEPVDSVYTRENVYWLRKGVGLADVPVSGGSPSPAAPGTFQRVERFEQDQIPVLALPADPESDYWYWSYVDQDNPATFTLPVAGLGTGGSPANLKVDLLGATSSGNPQEHHAVIRLNGTQIGETWWDGLTRHVVDFPFNEALLNEGDNTVEVSGILDPGIPYSQMFVNKFDLTCARNYTAVADRLAFRGDANPVVTVDGFSTSDIRVFNVSDPKHPKPVQGVTIDGSAGNFRASLVPSSSGTNYVATTSSGLGTALWMRNDAPSKLKTGGADYVIITAGWLTGPAGDLASYRSAHGLSSRVVDVEDIMDEFNFGITNPYAIRDFLSQAVQTWSPAPRYVLLAGDASFDYKDNLGLGGNLVPLVMRSSLRGLFPADNRIADISGDDGVPEMAIGRLPVRSEAEFRDYLDKLVAYEASTGKPWSSHVLLAADDADAGGDFAASADVIDGVLPGNLQTDRIELPGAGLDAERARLFDFMANGLGYINYNGDGSMDRLASEGLLTTDDVGALPDTMQLPVVLALTCLINRFEMPDFPALGEELVRRPGGGVIAVWGPTGQSFNDQATVLGTRFFADLIANQSKRLGDYVLDSLQVFGGSGGTSEMLDIYTLLGDPALKLKKFPKPKPSPGGSGE